VVHHERANEERWEGDVTAGADYTERVRRVNAQRERLGLEAYSPARWDDVASGYRFDPRRALDRNLEILASYVDASDELVDVGGGAGRIGLPLALRCRSLTNVEPSAGMARAFEEVAAAAAISNARVVVADWLGAEAIEGDLVITVDVVYFVAEIEPFLRKLASSARRRVLISIWAVPPPARNATLFRVVHSEDQVSVPGHRELIAVLWEMGVLPDVRVLPHRFSWPESRQLPTTRDAAVEWALDEIGAADRAPAAERIEAQFDALFTRTEDGYLPTWRDDAQGLLITWPTGTSSGTEPAN
jgi:hypothetical protein